MTGRLAFIDNLAACEGLTNRREALGERPSRIAREDEFWSLVSRFRAFRGPDNALSAGHRYYRRAFIGPQPTRVPREATDLDRRSPAAAG